MLVVMTLPGTTSASSAPAPLPGSPTADPQLGDAPILLQVSLAHLLLAAIPESYGTPEGAAGVSPFAQGQIVSMYGFPGICFMGELGCHDTPAGSVGRARELARAHDAVNGERGVQPALHLIVAVAQPHPGRDGTYLQWMPEEAIHEWVEAARRERVLLFLDVQIGWSDPLREVRRLDAVLREPFVHLALDPEFATREKALPPGDAIGTVSAAQVNAVQAHLAALVREHALPPKVLVLHQFKPGMLTDKDRYAPYDEVEVTIDMDGFGGPEAKISGYDAYALVGSDRAAFKLFFHWDTPLLTPAQLQALPHPPDYVIYQ
jgi:hypothetical protein